MSEDDEEREVRIETTSWGTEKEIVYVNGERVGEIRYEERGGILGFGGTPVRVEYHDGVEVGYEKAEHRGGFFGIGTHEAQVRYSPDGKEIGYSRVEERGGFLGIGGHHVRVGYDVHGNEVDHTVHEKRGGFLGFGSETVRVTRSNGRNSSNNRSSDAKRNSGSSGSVSSGLPEIGGLLKPLIILGIVLYVGDKALDGCRAWLDDATKRPQVKPVRDTYPPPIDRRSVIDNSEPPRSLCGHASASPPRSLIAPWSEYRCRTGSEREGCLPRGDYTLEPRRGCPDVELCCPPEPAIATETSVDDADDHRPVPTTLEAMELYAHKDHAAALSAARRRFALDRDPEALLVIVQAACKVGEIDLARDAFAQLDEELEPRTRIPCRGIELTE